MKNRIFQKLMGLFLLFYLFLFGAVIALYCVGLHNMETEHEINTALQTENLVRNINAEVDSIGIKLRTMMYQPELRTLGFYYDQISESSRRTALLETDEELEQLCYSSAYIENVGLLIRRESGVSSVYSVNFNELFEQNVRNIAEDSSEAGQRILLYRNNIYIVQTALDRRSQKICVVMLLSSSKLQSDLKVLLNANELVTLEYSGRESPLYWEVSASGDASLEKNYVERQTTISSLGCVLTKYSDKSLFGEYILSFRVLFIILGCMFFVSIVIFYSVTSQLVQKPIHRLMEAIEKVNAEQYDYRIPTDEANDFQPIFEAFNRMMAKIAHMIQEVYEKVILLQKAQLSQYQSQIDPHFLYNSFYTMRRMIDMGQQDEVKEFLCHLGDYFVFLHHGGDNDVISLEEELRHAQTYAEIQKIRFRNRLTVEWNVDTREAVRYQVPRLIIQPLLENAFQHSLEQKAAGGVLRVMVERQGDVLLCAVEDNGRLTAEQLESIRKNLSAVDYTGRISAIMNINRRLFLYYGKRQILFVDQSPLGGLRIMLRFPRGPEEGENADVPAFDC